MMFADIILPLNMPNVLTYGVPVDIQDNLTVGMRVEVNLGKNKLYSGIVEHIHNEQPEAYQVKPIKNILDKEPVVNLRQLQFWKWIAHYYMAAPGEVMQAALPAHLKLIGETRLLWSGKDIDDSAISYDSIIAAQAIKNKKEITITELKKIAGSRQFASVLNELLEHELILINDALEEAYKPKKEKIVHLSPDYASEDALMLVFEQLQKAPKQLAVIMSFIEMHHQEGIVKHEALLAKSGASAIHIKTLVDKGILIIEESIIDRIPIQTNQEVKAVTLTESQQAAYDKLKTTLTEKAVTLLHGVTGSGKTLLYIQQIHECIQQGKQALMLLPEIALTTQLVSRLQSYFGESLGVYHSHFSNNERVEIWEKVRKGQHSIVVGPRSALWLPFTNLGIVIVDEEHDSSYKQRDTSPRFHARDAAIYLAGLHKAKLILGSATPSVESLYNVQQQKYGYVPLKERYLGVKMPEITLVNSKTIDLSPQSPVKMITPDLQKAIGEALEKKRQVILFQNRRGYSPFQLCMTCGYIPQCKNCAVSLTYHKSSDKLHCHYCGTKSAVMHACPSCGNTSIISKTFGTEKIEEEVHFLFPKAKIARMDVDSMRRKNSIAELFVQLERGKVDILVGTQMVVKGLDFSGVSLVGILSADNLLSFPDFRVNERAFQLMEQVSGRAGRSDGEGKVIIQTYNAAHPVLKWVCEHDVTGFYKHEIKFREAFGYPPYTRMIKLIVKHEDESKVMYCAGKFAEALHQLPDIKVEGPSPALVPRIRNQYIHEIWIKCKKDSTTLERVKQYMKLQRQHILTQKGYNSVQIIFDVDPT